MCRRIAIFRSYTVSFSPIHRHCQASYQKLLGLYLLATIRMATLESDSIGYAPNEALAKCSLT